MHLILLAIIAAGVIGPLDQNVVSPDWLRQNLDNPDVIVLEIGRGQETIHPHIPGARYLDIDTIVRHEGWPPDELPPVDQLREAFENAGIGDTARIVLYSEAPLYATRAWFTLDYLGHGERAAILDGGFPRWIAEKRPTLSTRVQHLPKAFTPRPDPTVVISHDEVRKAVNAGEAVLIDARSGYEFHGFRRGGQVVRRGHIPGAHCEFWKANLTKNGAFKSPAELKAEYARIVGKPDARVIVYCRTGMEASMPYFILRSLGYNVALYDGSYAEWSRDRAAAVEKLSSRR